MTEEKECSTCENSCEHEHTIGILLHVISGDCLIMRGLSLFPQMPIDAKKLLEKRITFLKGIIEGKSDD